MKHVPLDAKVECSDGHGGRSVGLIVDSKTLKMTHFVVKLKTRPHVQRLVPIDKVANSSSAEISLDCTVGELDRADAFVVTDFKKLQIHRPIDGANDDSASNTADYMTVKSEIEQIPEGELDLRVRAPVEAVDGRVGHLEELLSDDETGQTTHIVLEEGHFWGKKDVMLPISVVDRSDQGGTIHLSIDKATVQSLLAVPTRQGRTSTNFELESWRRP